MKKLLILLLIVCLTAGSLLACNPENGGNTGDNGNASDNGNTGDNGNIGDNGNTGDNGDNGNGDSLIPGVEDGFFDPDAWTKPE